MGGLETSPLPAGYVAGFISAVLLAGMIRLAKWASTNPIVESAVAFATVPRFSMLEVLFSLLVSALLLASFYVAMLYGPRRIH